MSIDSGSRIFYDSHMHTPLCKHAQGEPEEYARQAYRRGLRGIIITCHNPDPGGWSPRVRMAPGEFEHYLELVERARRAWEGRVDVRLGLESDYYPGAEPWLEELHEQAPFHYILGSVHSHLPQYKELYFDGDREAFQRTYFEHLARAAETGLFDCLSHPDLVKNDFPRHWDPEKILDGIREALDRIAATGVAMELNTSGVLKVVQEMNPGPVILREIHERGIPMVLGSDSHQPHRVGDGFEEALMILGAIGFETVSLFEERQRHELPIEEVLRTLEPAD